MELFSIRIQRTFQLVSTDYAHQTVDFIPNAVHFPVEDECPQMPEYENSTHEFYREINFCFHGYRGLFMDSVYNSDISSSYFVRCSSMILLTYPDMDVSGATTAKNRLMKA